MLTPVFIIRGSIPGLVPLLEGISHEDMGILANIRKGARIELPSLESSSGFGVDSSFYFVLCTETRRSGHTGNEKIDLQWG